MHYSRAQKAEAELGQPPRLRFRRQRLSSAILGLFAIGHSIVYRALMCVVGATQQGERIEAAIVRSGGDRLVRW